MLAGDLDEAVRVGGVGGADDEDELALRGQGLDGLLAVGGRVTDVVGLGPDRLRELLLQAGDDRAGLVDREGGLVM